MPATLLGRIASKTESIGGSTHTFAYTYDPAGRLTEVRQDTVLTASYSYDRNGNRLSRTDGGGTLTAAYDVRDRLEQFGTTAYVHNAAGERQSKTAAGQTTDYQHDTLGNLTGVTLPDATQIDYVLDGAGRRVGKKRNGTLVQGFLYQDGLKPIAELDGGNNIVSRFVYADAINVPAYMIRAGVTYRIITDHLGSPRLVLDAATGSVVQRLDYDAFGIVILDTNPGFQPFGFAGGLYDKDTDLTQYGLRNYDSEAGRWTTKDPGGFAGGHNLYAAVNNDPINFIDPLGDTPLRGKLNSGSGAIPSSQTGVVTIVDPFSTIQSGPRRPIRGRHYRDPGPSRSCAAASGRHSGLLCRWRAGGFYALSVAGVAVLAELEPWLMLVLTVKLFLPHTIESPGVAAMEYVKTGRLPPGLGECSGGLR